MKIFKKFFYCLSAFLFLNSFNGFALSIYNAHFSIAPLYQLQNGVVNEYVYDKDDEGNYAKVSELDWQIKNLSFAGFQSAFGYKDLNINLNFMYGFPKSSGYMLDSDWLNYLSDPELKTNFSQTDNENNQNIIFKAKIMYNFDIFKYKSLLISIQPLLGFDFTYYDFGSNSGYYQYSSSYTESYETAEKVYSEDLEVDYTRDDFEVYLGSDFIFNFFNNYIAKLSLGITPYSYIYSFDSHVEKNIVYLDRMSGLFKRYNCCLDLSYNLNKNFVFGINGDFYYLSQMQGLSKLTGITGTATSKSSTTFIKQSTVPRCSGYWWDVGAYAKVQF